MRILFNSKKAEYKTPFGCLTAGEACTLHIHIPETVGATHVVCILHREGGETTEVTMPKVDAKGVYDVFSATFRLEDTGLYFYYFRVFKSAGSFRLFKQGDKVMQTSNNYDLQTFNGDQGIIAHIDSKKKKFTVLFDGSRPVEYAFDEADQLTLAYAITVHKSQGCEFPAVVLPILSQHNIMLQRNLLYTAVTRAKHLLVLIGSKRAILTATANTRQAPRYSLLAERFQTSGEEPEIFKH